MVGIMASTTYEGLELPVVLWKRLEVEVRLHNGGAIQDSREHSAGNDWAQDGYGIERRRRLCHGDSTGCPQNPLAFLITCRSRWVQ